MGVESLSYVFIIIFYTIFVKLKYTLQLGNATESITCAFEVNR